MIKVVVLLPRRNDVSREDFQRYLRETHLPLVARIPGMRRLVINWVLPDPTGPAPDYDAVAEDWFDDAKAMEAAFTSAEGKAVVDDTPNFLDMSRFRLMVTEEEDPSPESCSTCCSTDASVGCGRIASLTSITRPTRRGSTAAGVHNADLDGASY
jgi:uncharacterized protein (TIGR02118 family)